MTAHKKYTIEITHPAKDGCWYNTRIGQRFEAILSAKKYTNDVDGIAFKVSDVLFVSQLHCKIIDEKVFKKYPVKEEAEKPAFERPKAEYSNRQF